MSNQRGSAKLRPKVASPPFQSHSESVPTGQIQLQNDLRYIQEIARKAMSMNIPAG
jgi:hypothetical protein